MTLTFKRLNDSPDYYYNLELGYKPYGEFESYVENNPNKGVITGVMIRLEKVWRCGEYRNELGEVYVSPLMFASEYYPVVLGHDIDSKVETLIKEAQ